MKLFPGSMQSRRRMSGIVFALAVIGLVPVAWPQTGANADALDVVQVRPNFWLIAGAGGNVGVEVGADGVVLTDAGSAAAASRLIAAVAKLTDKPIRYIINTSADADHVGGNAALAKAGKTFFNVSGPRADMARAMTNGGAAAVLASNDVLRRMSETAGKGTAFPADGWPTEAFFQPHKTLYLNPEGIEIFRAPAAHSDSDSFVLFRHADVIMAGDVLDTTRFPVIDTAKGGTIQGEIAALNRLIDMAIPGEPLVNQGGGTYVISGHGRVCDQADVVEYRDMVVVVRDVVQDMIKRGMTLDQIQAASPALPFETQYGVVPGATKAFVEAIYKGLTAKK